MSFALFKAVAQFLQIHYIVGKVTGEEITLCIGDDIITYQVQGTIYGIYWRYITTVKSINTGKVGRALTKAVNVD
jgi:hypothetical protein